MPRVVMESSYERLSAFAAAEVARHLDEMPDLLLCLPTGGTPEGMYAELVRMYKNGKANFSSASITNLNEYCGLPKWHQQSYQRYLRDKLLDRVNANKERTYLMDGCAEDKGRYCTSVEERIRKLGGIDLCVLGIGTDGHIAFDMPGSAFDSRTRVARLSEQTIADNCRHFGNIRGNVPKHAVTMGIGTILDSRDIVLLANGERKADAVYRALKCEPDVSCPASALQLHEDALFILDEAAASKL
jgi:glucosamine-6-phosphate deaminase